MFPLIRASLVSLIATTFIALGAGTSTYAPAPQTRPRRAPASRPGATLSFLATAYCHDGVTQSGVDTHTGIAAADPAQLPVGSVVHIQTGTAKYDGIYTVLDTGTKVQGRHVDLFIRNCDEAQQFGKHPVRVMVLRRGWDPKQSAPKTAVPGK